MYEYGFSIYFPVIDSDKCYIDGGVLNNFPLNDCLEKIAIQMKF